MTTRPDKRASGLVLLLAATAIAAAASVPAAGALGPEDLAAVTTSIADTIDEVVDLAPLPSATDDVVEEITGSSTSTTTATSTTSTSTTTAAPPTTTTTRAAAAPPRADDAATAAPPPPTSAPPTSIPEPAAEERAGVALVPDRVDLGVPPLTEHVDVAPSMWPGELTLQRGPRSTLAILDVLRSLDSTPALVATVLAPFPVAGPAVYTDDWGAPRAGGRRHQGTDIFAARGTPIIAATDGVVNGMTTTGIGGTALRLSARGGTFFYYAHLDRFAAGLANGDRVEKGAVLGFIGNSGNAISTPPHLHFEIHPGGGLAVRPIPFLDRWLDEAAIAAGAIHGAPAASAVVRPAVGPAAEAEPAPARSAAPRITSFTREPVEAASVNPLPLLSLFVFGGLALRAWARSRRTMRGSGRA